MTEDIQRLVERIEAASGLDRELDREIMLAVGYRYEERNIGCRYEDGTVALDWVYVDPKTDKWRSTHPLEFTSSIDAAMTLVQADWFWRVGHDGEGADPSLFRADIGEPVSFGFVRAVAATPALAITAAALRSRITERQNDG